MSNKLNNFDEESFKKICGIIREERLSQIEKGFDASHDDSHKKNELALASVIYSLPEKERNTFLHIGGDSYLNIFEYFWPFEWDSFKPGGKNLEGRINDITKSLALNIAELERLLRIKNGGEG